MYGDLLLMNDGRSSLSHSSGDGGEMSWSCSMRRVRLRAGLHLAAIALYIVGRDEEGVDYHYQQVYSCYQFMTKATQIAISFDQLYIGMQ